MFLIRLGFLALIVLLFLPGGPRPIGPDGIPVADDAGFCERYPKTCAAGEEIGEALKHKLIFAVGWARERIGSQMAAGRDPEQAPGSTGGPGYGQGGGRWDGSSGPGRPAWADPRDTLRPEDLAPDWRGRP